MYVYNGESNIKYEFNLEKLTKLIDKTKNLEILSIKLSMHVPDTRKLLKELYAKGYIKKYLINQYLPWSEQEDIQLDMELKDNLTVKEISEKHRRTIGSIKSRINRHEESKKEENFIDLIEQELKNTLD